MNESEVGRCWGGGGEEHDIALKGEGICSSLYPDARNTTIEVEPAPITLHIAESSHAVEAKRRVPATVALTDVAGAAANELSGLSSRSAPGGTEWG